MSAGGYSGIDMSTLPAPAVVEVLDYETILAEMVADLQERDPSFSALVESDPAYKILEVAAFRETLLRQRVNEAALAVLLPHASGTDLENLAALSDVERLLITPGDPDAFPPVAAVYEEDESLRRRAQLAVEGQTVAGSSGAYIFHSLGVAGVKDACPDSSSPGVVEVYILALDGDGTPSPELLASVDAVLSPKEVRPLTDNVDVQAAAIVNYTIEATLHMESGPDAAVAVAAARAELDKVVASSHSLGGRGLAISAIHKALHQPGVVKVALTSPANDLAPTISQALYCTSITINEVPVDG